MATFPEIVPTARNFRPGVYPQKSYRSLSGAVVKRTYGDSPYGAQLELEYDNIPDATVVTLLNHYRNQTPANRRFNISASVQAGMSFPLSSIVNGYSDGLRWEYANPPEVQSIRPGFNNVRISLVGEIRNPRLDD